MLPRVSGNQRDRRNTVFFVWLMMYADLMGNHKNHRIKSLWDNIVTWHNSVVILKQQLKQLAAVIGSGLIQALKPFVNAMNNALSGLIKFAQNVVNALGKIFGWEMEVNTSGLQMDEDAYDVDPSGLEDVADAAGDAGKATDGAAKSAKKLKEQLQGFDKLNVIRSQDDTGSSGSGGGGGSGGSGGGSGGGGGGGTSGGDVSASLKKTKSMFESDIDNLFELGSYISDKLSDAMESIQWDKIYKKADRFGIGLANFLNGLITPRLFANVGKTIAGALNTALHFLDSFGNTFKWDNFGKSLGAGLTAFIKNIQWERALSAAHGWGKGVGDAIAGFVRETDFNKVGETISNFIKTKIVFFLSLGSSIPWSEVGEKLAETINGAIGSFPAAELANTIDAWVKGIWDLLVSMVKNVDKGKLISKIKEFIGALDFGTITILLTSLALVKAASFTITIAAALINAICKEFIKILAAKLAVKMAGSAVLQGAIGNGLGGAAANSGPFLGNALGGAGGGGILSTIATIAGALAGLGLTSKGFFGLWKKGWNTSDGVMVGAGTGITLAALGIAGVLTGPLAAAIIGITGGFALIASKHSEIGAAAKSTWEEIKSRWSGIAKTIKDAVIDSKWSFEDMKNSGISNTTEERKRIDSNYKGIKNTVTSNSETARKNAHTKFKDMKNQGDTATKGLRNSVSKNFGGMSKDANTSLGSKGLQGKVKTNMGNTRTKGYNAIKGINKDVNGIWGSIGTSAEKSIGGKGKGSVMSKITGAFDNIRSSVKKKFPFTLGKIVTGIKLPEIEVTKATKEGATIRKFSVKEKIINSYAKAYDNPYMFTRPTLVPSLGGAKMFGDGNGGEMVYGHQNLMDDISAASGASEMSAIGNRQLANDQRIIQLLTVIAEKEFGISQDAVFRAVRKGASDYSMRTGRSAFEF